MCIAGGRHAMGGQQFFLRRRPDNLASSTACSRSTASAPRGRVRHPVARDPPTSSDLPGSDEPRRQGRPAGTGVGVRAEADRRRPPHHRRVALGEHARPRPHDAAVRHDIESFKLINGRGNVVNCSRCGERGPLRLAIGGYGLFGFVYSVTLRLVPRRKLERVVEVRELAGLADASAHQGRVHLRRLPVRDRREVRRLPEARRVLVLPAGGGRAGRCRRCSASSARASGPSSVPRAHQQERGLRRYASLHLHQRAALLVREVR